MIILTYSLIFYKYSYLKKKTIFYILEIYPDYILGFTLFLDGCNLNFWLNILKQNIFLKFIGVHRICKRSRGVTN